MCSETEEERRARKMKMALELAKRAREGGNEKLGGSDQKQDDEKDKQTTSGIGGSWSGSATEVDSHKPKVGTWGLFERPADISKAYGGGRKVGVGGYVEPDDIARAKQNKTNSLLASVSCCFPCSRFALACTVCCAD